MLDTLKMIPSINITWFESFNFVTIPQMFLQMQCKVFFTMDVFLTTSHIFWTEISTHVIVAMIFKYFSLCISNSITINNLLLNFVIINSKFTIKAYTAYLFSLLDPSFDAFMLYFLVNLMIFIQMLPISNISLNIQFTIITPVFWWINYQVVIV